MLLECTISVHLRVGFKHGGDLSPLVRRVRPQSGELRRVVSEGCGVRSGLRRSPIAWSAFRAGRPASVDSADIN